MNANLQQNRTTFPKAYQECDGLLSCVVAFREQRIIPNAVFFGERFRRTHTLYFKVIRLPHIQRRLLFSERVGPEVYLFF